MVGEPSIFLRLLFSSEEPYNEDRIKICDC